MKHTHTHMLQIVFVQLKLSRVQWHFKLACMGENVDDRYAGRLRVAGYDVSVLCPTYVVHLHSHTIACLGTKCLNTLPSPFLKIIEMPTVATKRQKSE